MSSRVGLCAFLCILAVAPLLCIPSARGQQLLPADIKKLPECSVAKTNERCRLTIDRDNPISPPTIQMYSNQSITVVLKKPKTFERYFLDIQTAQATVAPDVASGILTALTPSLGNIKGLLASRHVFPAIPATADPCGALSKLATPGKGQLEAALGNFQSCLTDLSTKAITIYRSLEPWTAPNALLPQTVVATDLATIQSSIKSFLTSELQLSGKINFVSNDATLKASDQDAPSLQDLADVQKSTDAIATDLMGYSQRITDLGDPGFQQLQGFQLCENLIAVTDKERKAGIQCVSITSRSDDDSVYGNMVTRTVTYALDTMNYISYSQQATLDPTKKVSVGSVAINFADKPVATGSTYSALRWEASAGVFFSTLAIRSFSVAPIFTNKVITDNLAQQNVLHPTVVPFAAANYRLANYFPHARWNSALYWTGAVGVNPNTVSADIASGLSLSWRLLMVSALWHYGHDVRLTQGFTANESLGPTFMGTLPTQTYWRSSFAVGLSVRIPSLTGR
jgi:hypothetical protein